MAPIAEVQKGRALKEVRVHEDPLATRLGSKLSRMITDRKPWEDVWDDITAYLHPRRGTFWEDRKEGLKYGDKAYDGHPSWALHVFARGLQGYTASPSIAWFRLRTRNYRIDKMQVVRKWLEECDEGLYAAFNSSNFYRKISEYFLDVGSIGTATIYCEEDLKEDRLSFQTIHPKEVYIDENQYGEVDQVFRRFEMSARNIVTKFEKDGYEKIPVKIRDAAKKADTCDTMYELVHACYPNDDRVYGRIDKKNLPWASVYFVRGEKETLSEKGYYKNPYAVWRWSKNSSEIYGRSPAHNALIDILVLNQMGQDYLDAAQFALYPPMMAPVKMAGQVHLEPHGISYLNEPGSIAPIVTTLNFQVALEREEQFRDLINKHYHVDFFLMLAQADVQMTATEIVERKTEKAAMLGPYIAIMNTECFNHIIDRVFQIEYDAGRLPEVPGELQELYGERIDPEYMGPLAQAQKELFEISGIVKALETSMPLLQMDPGVMQNIKLDETFRRILVARGFPSALLNTDAEVQAARAVQLQMAQQQAELDQTQQAAAAMKDLAGKVDPKSILAQQVGA